MRKNHYIPLIAAVIGVLSMSVPLITKAQTAVDTEASVGIDASVDAGQNPGAPRLRDTLKQKIQQNYQAYSENVRNNEDYRNTVMEKRRPGMASSTTDGPHPLLRAHIEGDIDRLASSSDRKGDREEIQSIRLEWFSQARDRLVAELTRALDNLKQIRGRISTRIDLETKNGKDMTSASALLVTADAAITHADSAIQTLKSYNPTATTTVQASSTVNVQLDMPRKIGEDAIGAVNDARTALSDVVAAIAKALGVTLSHE